MTWSGNNGLSFENLVTYGAVRACALTVFGTGRCYCGILNLGVSECCNGFLCNKNCFTYGAMLTLGLTSLGTGCCYCCVNHLGVSESCNGFLCNKNCFTYGAVLTLGLTFRGTGCGYCLIDNLGVTSYRNGLCFSFNFSITYGTVNNKVIRALFSTSCVYNIFLNSLGSLMAKRLDIGLFGCTTTASHDYITCFCTIGGNLFLLGCIYVIAGCQYSFGCSADFSVTYGAVNNEIVRAIFRTGCIYTVFLNSLRSLMAKSSYGILCNENLVTYGTVLTLGLTSHGTGRSHCSINNLSVTKSIDNFLCSVDLATLRTLLTIGKTALGTSSCLARDNFLGVNMSGIIENLYLCDIRSIVPLKTRFNNQTKILSSYGTVQINDLVTTYSCAGVNSLILCSVIGYLEFKVADSQRSIVIGILI